MREFNEHNITDAVVDRYKNTPDPRLKQIMSSLVRHLHDFVRDVEPTEDEWGKAIDYLTRTGQLCTDKRQEFILLSDTLGVSMLVDAINHGVPKGATETTVLGPFYVQNPPEAPLGANIQGEAKGEPLYIEGTIRGRGWQAGGERDGRHLALRRRRFLRRAEAGTGRTDAARPLPYRLAGPLQLLDHHAALLSDPLRWHRRRNAEG